MSEFAASKSQVRALTLCGLTSDGTARHAAAVLAAAGFPADGVPAGHTFRSAAKLSDAEYRALFVPDALTALMAPVPETTEARQARERAELDARKAARKAASRAWARGEYAPPEDEEDADMRERALAGRPRALGLIEGEGSGA